jgi:hypothetical protein
MGAAMQHGRMMQPQMHDSQFGTSCLSLDSPALKSTTTYSYWLLSDQQLTDFMLYPQPNNSTNNNSQAQSPHQGTSPRRRPSSNTNNSPHQVPPWAQANPQWPRPQPRTLNLNLADYKVPSNPQSSSLSRQNNKPETKNA